MLIIVDDHCMPTVWDVGKWEFNIMYIQCIS